MFCRNVKKNIYIYTFFVFSFTVSLFADLSFEKLYFNNLAPKSGTQAEYLLESKLLDDLANHTDYSIELIDSEKMILNFIHNKIFNIYSSQSDDALRQKELKKYFNFWLTNIESWRKSKSFIPERLFKKINLLEKVMFKSNVHEDLTRILSRMTENESELSIMECGFSMSSLNKLEDGYRYADTVRDHLGEFLEDLFPSTQHVLFKNKFISFGINHKWTEKHSKLGDISILEYIYIYGISDFFNKQRSIFNSNEIPSDFAEVVSRMADYKLNVKDRLIKIINKLDDKIWTAKGEWIDNMQNQNIDNVGLSLCKRSYNKLYSNLINTIKEVDFTKFQGLVLTEVYKNQEKINKIDDELNNMGVSLISDERDINKQANLTEKQKKIAKNHILRKRYILKVNAGLKTLIEGEQSFWNQIMLLPSEERLSLFVSKIVEPKASEIIYRLFGELEGYSRGLEYVYADDMVKFGWIPLQPYNLERDQNLIFHRPNQERWALKRAANEGDEKSFKNQLLNMMKKGIKDERSGTIIAKEFFEITALCAIHSNTKVKDRNKLIADYDGIFVSSSIQVNNKTFNFVSTADGDEHRMVFWGADNNSYIVSWDIDNYQSLDIVQRKLDTLQENDKTFWDNHEMIIYETALQAQNYDQAGTTTFEESLSVMGEYISKNISEKVFVDMNPNKRTDDSYIHEMENFLDENRKYINTNKLAKYDEYYTLLRGDPLNFAIAQSDHLVPTRIKFDYLPRINSKTLKSKVTHTAVGDKMKESPLSIDNILKIKGFIDHKVEETKESGGKGHFYFGENAINAIEKYFAENEQLLKYRKEALNSNDHVAKISDVLEKIGIINLNLLDLQKILEILSKIRIAETPYEIKFNSFTELDAKDSILNLKLINSDETIKDLIIENQQSEDIIDILVYNNMVKVEQDTRTRIEQDSELTNIAA